MNVREVLELFKAARSGKGDTSLDSLLEGFQEMLELDLKQKEMPSPSGSSLEEQLRAFEKAKSDFERLKSNYDDFCASEGKSPREMQEYFNNSAHFSPKAWEDVQGLNRRYGLDYISSREKPSKKRWKRGGKRFNKWASI